LTSHRGYEARWLFEGLEASEDGSDSSQHRWTSKVPVVSAALSNPSTYTTLLKMLPMRQDSQVLDRNRAGFDSAEHPKMIYRHADNLALANAL
jgi:hypothetical protein